jgi:hypothetical protein
MTMKIGFFDEAKVGADAKRLAECFDVAADVPRQNPLADEAKTLFESVSKSEVPAFNADEKEFLKLRILEATKKDQSAAYPTSRAATNKAQANAAAIGL